MGTFLINGGRPLYGTVAISGSKNAALPILFATLVTGGVSQIYNLPDIGDVKDTLDILSEMGAEISVCNGRVSISTDNVRAIRPPDALVSKIRASSYLMGACLARFGVAYIQSFGGCSFSNRPIDLHVMAAEAFGATLSDGVLKANKLKPACIKFRVASVGATVNAILMASSVRGKTELHGCACEPHITALIDFLISAGADIKQDGDKITIRGGSLHAGSIFVPADMIEAGTYMLLPLVTGGKVRAVGVSGEELNAISTPFVRSGLALDSLSVGAELSGNFKTPTDICTAPYPGFPTDLQPISAPVLARHLGGSIEERVWEERFGYLEHLGRFGVRYTRISNKARIYPSELTCADSFATDLRGGAACIMAALGADGISTVASGEVVLRGYERIVEKLSRLGAEIEYKE